jgi:uncharacterized protein (DUF58 family)
MGYFLAFFVLVIAVLQRFSRDRDLSLLDIVLESDKKVVEPGEEFNLLLSISNPGWFIYPYFSVDLNLPPGIEVADGRRRFTSWLLPKQQINMQIPCVINKRGRYLGQHISLYAGDFLGLDSVENEFPQYVDMVCLPKAAQLETLARLPGGLYGELSVNRFIFEDPILSIGYRDYTGREPQKQISWSQSARMGRLMVKQFDYTEDASVLIAVNAQAKASDQSYEEAYSLARAVCEKLEDMGIMYSFCTNAITAGDINSWNYLSSGLGTQHLMHILEGLGRCGYRFASTLEKMLVKTLSNNTNTFAMIFISPEEDEARRREAEQIARRFGIRFFSATAVPSDGQEGKEAAK